jgi:hypothetical protein
MFCLAWERAWKVLPFWGRTYLSPSPPHCQSYK